MKNKEKLRIYKIKSGSTITQSKSSLENVPGLIRGDEKDCITLEENDEFWAQMECGHAISRDSMTYLL